MRHFAIYVEDGAVYIKEDEDVIKIKDFDSEDAAEGFVKNAADKAINHVNAYFMGEDFVKTDNIKNLKELLGNEPASKEKAVLGTLLDILESSRASKG